MPLKERSAEMTPRTLATHPCISARSKMAVGEDSLSYRSQDITKYQKHWGNWTCSLVLKSAHQKGFNSSSTLVLRSEQHYLSSAKIILIKLPPKGQEDTRSNVDAIKAPPVVDPLLKNKRYSLKGVENKAA